MTSSRTPIDLSAAREQGYFNIGQASAASGVSIKMIRHYEHLGVIPEAVRTSAKYRLYSADDIERLQFVRRARVLGFSIQQIRTLVGLWSGDKPAHEVRRLALEQIRALQAKIRGLQELQASLETLADRCWQEGAVRRSRTATEPATAGAY